MSFRPSALFFALLLANPALAQAPPAPWSANTNARGWAFADVDGSFLFLESRRQEFMHWDPQSGLRGTRPAPLLEERSEDGDAPQAAEDPHLAAVKMLYGEGRPSPKRNASVRKRLPERWILDPKDNTWAVAGSTLSECDPQGRVLSRHSLPAPVADMVRVQDGFFLSYRTVQPFVQKFDWRGKAVWTHQKARPATPAAVPLHRIVISSESGVLLAEMGALSFTNLGPGASGEVYFTERGATAGPLRLGRGGRGPMSYCPSRNAVLAVFSEADAASALPQGKGLALACFRLDKGTLTWRSTGLEEGCQLVGINAAGAVFTSPEGGLVVVPVPD